MKFDICTMTLSRHVPYRWRYVPSKCMMSCGHLKLCFVRILTCIVKLVDILYRYGHDDLYDAHEDNGDYTMSSEKTFTVHMGTLTCKVKLPCHVIHV
jgi:hypothetical protein